MSSISLLFWGQVGALAMTKLKPSSCALAKQARCSFSSMHVSQVGLLPRAGPYSIVEHCGPAHCIYFDFTIISGGVHDSCWSTEGGIAVILSRAASAIQCQFVRGYFRGLKLQGKRLECFPKTEINSKACQLGAISCLP